MAATHFYGSEFFGGEFFFGRVIVIDTHDGIRKRKRWEDQRLARERLREQIRAALDGPQATALAPKLEAKAQSGERGLEWRVDLDMLVADVVLYGEVLAAAAREAEIDFDDEDVMMLI